MIKLGMLGLSPGNGHPYSWAAIFNGYDKKAMADCPFEVIPAYLAEEPPESFGIEDAKVTHLWTQDREVSEHVAAASRVETIVERAEDMIGAVDGVVLARDDGENHLSMARPFIEADIPIFIDKPLTDNADDLRAFIQYYERGKKILSCSSMRFDESIQNVRDNESLGRMLTANAVIGKLWRTYGIHIIEGVTAVLGDEVETVQNVGRPGEEIVHLRFKNASHAVLQTIKGLKALNFSFFAEHGNEVITTTNAFWGFKRTLESFVSFMKNGTPPFPWSHTVATAKIVVAGRMSLDQGGRVVPMEEVV